MFPELIDLPSTIAEAPALKADFGEFIRDWSCDLSPGNLIPGVTINKFLYFH